MSSAWSNNGLKISVFGESHGKGIGVVIDGFPAGIKIDEDFILQMMDRRRPGKNRMSTARSESDTPVIYSGICEGHTTGTPICCVINNSDTHSGDYSEMQTLARPGHADYTGFKRYSGFNDIRGGGHFSGRLTAPIVYAGAVCELYLKQHGITVGAHLASVKDACDDLFDPRDISPELLDRVKTKKVPVINDSAAPFIESAIEAARLDLDSVGGVIECAAVNVPAGLGNPMFGGIENVISSLVFGVPAVKGIEFGVGFGAAKLFGSENNDDFYADESGEIKTTTNNHGGILGGITSGMPIIFKAALKPTPSIAKPQNTIDFKQNKNAEIAIKGRHDPCVAVRAVPVIESCMSIALASFLI